MSSKVDLKLLKRFISELELALEAGEKIRTEKTDKDKYVIEMSKAMGLIAGVVTEATMLMGDLQNAMSQTGLPPLNKDDIINRILGKGGTGNAN